MVILFWYGVGVFKVISVGFIFSMCLGIIEGFWNMMKMIFLEEYLVFINKICLVIESWLCINRYI